MQASLDSHSSALVQLYKLFNFDFHKCHSVLWNKFAFLLSVDKIIKTIYCRH